jgi:hypothetical protein
MAALIRKELWMMIIFFKYIKIAVSFKEFD